MALPATIASNLHSDFKNVIMGPFAYDLFTDFFPVVNNGLSGSEGKAQTFLATADGPLVRAYFKVSKVGSPTDNIFCELRATVLSVGVLIPDQSQLLATSSQVAGSGLGTDADDTPVAFGFSTPYSLVTGTTYALVVKRTGALDATNKYALGYNNSTTYADGIGFNYISAATPKYSDSTVDFYFRAAQSTNTRYAFAVDKTNNKLRAYKSTDGGESWAEVDSANAPAITSTSNLKSTSAQLIGNIVYLVCPTTTTVGNIQKFQMASDTWGTAITGPGTTLNANVSGAAPVYLFVRPDGATIILVYNGATETVMGSARRRVKAIFYNGSSWGVEMDLSISTGFGDTTLPGDAIHYDLRSAMMGASGATYMFFTNTNESLLHCRIARFSMDAPTATTFPALMVPASIATSNSTAYPVGIGSAFRDDGFLKVALPVYDGSVIKVIRVKEVDAETAGNWTSTTAASVTPEVGACNLGVLIPDLLTAGRLFLFYSKSDRKIYYVHDGGSDAWVGEQQVRPSATVTCGALSGFNVDNAIAIQYLDEALTPDGSRFDCL